MRPPSGAQVELTAGDWHATVVEVGGGLRTLRRGGWEIVDGYPLDRMCNGGRGQALLPWPNRIRDGRYQFACRSMQLPLNEPDLHNAIHGLTRWAHWVPVQRSPTAVVFQHVLD